MQSEKTFTDMLIEVMAKDTQRYIAELKFLQDEIKALIGAIRTAPDLQSLRVVANDSVERMRKTAWRWKKRSYHDKS